MTQLNQTQPQFNLTLPPAPAWLQATLALVTIPAGNLTGNVPAAALTANLAAAAATAGLALIPAGGCMPFAADVVPAGWLLCDGTEYANATYPALSAYLLATTGNPYAGSDAAHFKVPDYTDVTPYGVSGGLTIGQRVSQVNLGRISAANVQAGGDFALDIPIWQSDGPRDTLEGATIPHIMQYWCIKA